MEADGVAVQEGVVDDRFSLLASLAAAVVEPDPCGEAVLLGECHAQVEDVGHCTYANASRFFSYRRSVHRNEPDYGRHVNAIALAR